MMLLIYLEKLILKSIRKIKVKLVYFIYNLIY
jgi:hypothetical protein